jgi:anti-anti-sigma factor
MEEKHQDGIERIETVSGVCTLILSGKIDAANFEEIQRQTFVCSEKEEVKSIVFDMNDVTYVSSAGLRMFSAVNRKTAELGKEYKLTHLREDILKLLQLTGYSSAFSIEVKNND